MSLVDRLSRILGGGKTPGRQSQADRNHPVAFIPIDALGLRIQVAAKQLLETRGSEGIRRNGWYDETQQPYFEGLCARMCEAYVFLARDDRTSRFASSPVPEPQRVSHSSERGDSHYWMQNEVGVMDLNFGPGDQPHAGYVNYGSGGPVTRIQGFRPWKDDPRYPSNKDARKIMDAVWAEADQEVLAEIPQPPRAT